MKVFLTSAALIGSLLLGSTAQAGGITDIIATLKNNSKLEFCGKGDAKKGIFSIRSFSGDPCKQSYAASAAIVVCWKANKDGFRDSGCVKNARKVLGVDQNSDPDGSKLQKAARDALKSAAKSTAGKKDVVALVCDNKKKLESGAPEEKGTIEEVCK